MASHSQSPQSLKFFTCLFRSLSPYEPSPLCNGPGESSSLPCISSSHSAYAQRYYFLMQSIQKLAVSYRYFCFAPWAFWVPRYHRTHPQKKMYQAPGAFQIPSRQQRFVFIGSLFMGRRLKHADIKGWVRTVITQSL